MKHLLVLFLIPLSLFGKIVILNDENFDHFQEDRYLIAGVFQNGCYPCSQAKKFIHALSKDNEEITFGFIDFEKHPSLVKKLNVKAFPSLYFFKEGEMVLFHPGPITQKKLNLLFQTYLEL